MFCSDMIDAATALNQSPRSEASAEDGADWARPLLERQLWVLGQLAEGGLQVARAIERQATGAGSGDGGPNLNDLALAYARVARAVRMTLLLQSRLIQDAQTADKLKAHTAHCAKVRQEAQRPLLEDERKARVERIVGRIAQGEHDDAETVERIVEEAAERLDQDDIYGDVLSKPVSEIVARICEDLGLDPDWPRLAEEAWARAEIESGAAGSPLAAFRRDSGREDPSPGGPRSPSGRRDPDDLGVAGGPRSCDANAMGSRAASP